MNYGWETVHNLQMARETKRYAHTQAWGPSISPVVLLKV